MRNYYTRKKDEKTYWFQRIHFLFPRNIPDDRLTNYFKVWLKIINILHHTNKQSLELSILENSILFYHSLRKSKI